MGWSHDPVPGVVPACFVPPPGYFVGSNKLNETGSPHSFVLVSGDFVDGSPPDELFSCGAEQAHLHEMNKVLHSSLVGMGHFVGIRYVGGDYWSQASSFEQFFLGSRRLVFHVLVFLFFCFLKRCLASSERTFVSFLLFSSTKYLHR